MVPSQERGKQAGSTSIAKLSPNVDENKLGLSCSGLGVVGRPANNSWQVVGRPANNSWLSGSLSQFSKTFCESAGFFDIVITILDVIQRLLALQFM